MQLQQIKYFLVLREELNFTRAAQRCGVSQPTLTGCIKRLEAALGGLLFARRRKISLTQLGRAMAPYFERIVQDAQDALDAADALRRNGQGTTTAHGTRRTSPDAPLEKSKYLGRKLVNANHAVSAEIRAPPPNV